MIEDLETLRDLMNEVMEVVRECKRKLILCDEVLTSIFPLFGDSPKEVSDTLRAMMGLSPSEIREALGMYKERYK